MKQLIYLSMFILCGYFIPRIDAQTTNTNTNIVAGTFIYITNIYTVIELVNGMQTKVQKTNVTMRIYKKSTKEVVPQIPKKSEFMGPRAIKHGHTLLE